jgi:hypothetical protein
MDNSGVILTLAYPDTIVRVSTEWFSPLLRFLGIGKKNYVRAGHAALVLINKKTGVLEYHDFGRYITPESYGRVRGISTDNELDFSLHAEITNSKIINIKELLVFLATHPDLTHGEGNLVASVCDEVDYLKASHYIQNMQNRDFVPYSVFKKGDSNCARFVTETLIASVTNKSIKRKLEKSKWFTPSTVGNVLLANTLDFVYLVSDTGAVSEFKGTQMSENLRCFLDPLKKFTPNIKGSLISVPVSGLNETAQWISGIGSGAWFELYDIDSKKNYRFRRVSPNGNVDVDAVYTVSDETFNYNLPFKFIHYSNCLFFHIKQNNTTYRFNRKTE